MKRFSKISIDDIKTIQVDSGVLLKSFDVENPIVLPENVICATSGGINPVCAPEYYDFSEDVDNAKQSKETKRIRGWNATISFTTLTISLAAIKLALGAADISGKVLSLRQRLQYAKDFKDIWWVGKRADDKLIAIRLIRTLSDSGFSLQTNKRGKGQISVTLKGHSSFAEKDKIPMEIYFLAESNIPIVPDEPEPPTASLYLYGTPSETGNIGLRNGESVTYYDGAVLSALPEVPEEYKWILIHTSHLYPANAKFFSVEPYVTTDGEYYIEYRERALECSCNPDKSTEWSAISEVIGWESSRIYFSHTLGKVFWSNSDIYHENGTLMLSASDPIPVSGIVDTINGIPIYEREVKT